MALSATTAARRAARAGRLREASERIFDPGTIQSKLEGLTGAQQDVFWRLYRSSRSQLTMGEMQQRREIVGLFKQTASDIEADIFQTFQRMNVDNWSLAGVRRVGRGQQLLDQINDRIRALGGQVGGSLSDGLLDQFKKTWLDSAHRLDSLTPESVAIKTGLLPDREILSLLNQPFNGGTFSERLGLITDDMAHNIQQSLIRSMMAEESWSEAARRIRGEMGTAGQKSVWRAEMIARTELARSQEIANAQLYAENSDVIEKIIWTAHPGACDECKDLHGERITDPAGFPPLHPNCVCDALAVPKSWDDLSEPGDGDFSITPQSRKQWAQDNNLADVLE